MSNQPNTSAKPSRSVLFGAAYTSVSFLNTQLNDYLEKRK